MEIFEEIDDEQRTQIYAHFGTTFNIVQNDIIGIRQWLKKQPHLPAISSDEKIRSLLAICKFKVEKTKRLIDSHYTIRSKLPELLEISTINPNSPLMMNCADINYFIPLPKLTDDLNRATVVKLTTSNPEMYNLLWFAAWVINVSEIRLLEDRFRTRKYILDLENCGMGHLTKTTPVLIRKLSIIFQKLYSSAFDAMHFINCPPIIGRFLKILSSILKPKIMDRIVVHDSLESLHKCVPKEVLPRDYGGNQKSLNELNEILKKRFVKYKDYFDHLDTLTVNESLRPGKPIDDDILGFYGNFKQLDFD